MKKKSKNQPADNYPLLQRKGKENPKGLRHTTQVKANNEPQTPRQRESWTKQKQSKIFIKKTTQRPKFRTDTKTPANS